MGHGLGRINASLGSSGGHPLQLVFHEGLAARVKRYWSTIRCMNHRLSTINNLSCISDTIIYSTEERNR